MKRDDWPFACVCCGQPARTAMPDIPWDLSPRRQATWHWLHLQRSLTPAQQEGLRDVLAQFDLCDHAFTAAFQAPSLTVAQQRRACRAWMAMSRSATRAWAALALDRP